ncbi:MAG: hypothetical protein KAH32_03395 [Chlamydiia bacterium]|nr:hypothetical protein [Chlamydiia bacterium]
MSPEIINVHEIESFIYSVQNSMNCHFNFAMLQLIREVSATTSAMQANIEHLTNIADIERMAAEERRIVQSIAKTLQD